MTLKLHIDVNEMTIGDQLDLEAATTGTAIVAWLVAHAGVTLEEVRPLKVRELKTLADQLATELSAQLTVSKASGGDS